MDAPLENDRAVRLHALVRGRVQGVFFREYTRRNALGLGLVGEVRNLPDGTTVEVVAEGPRAALEELLALLREGPPRSRVTEVEVRWTAARSESTSFQVR